MQTGRTMVTERQRRAHLALLNQVATNLDEEVSHAERVDEAAEVRRVIADLRRRWLMRGLSESRTPLAN